MQRHKQESLTQEEEEEEEVGDIRNGGHDMSLPRLGLDGRWQL